MAIIIIFSCPTAECSTRAFKEIPIVHGGQLYKTSKIAVVLFNQSPGFPYKLVNLVIVVSNGLT